MGFRFSSISVNLPFGIGGVSLVRSEAQAAAAWALYVEYTTRIATQRLPKGKGSVREALTSLYALFDITRSTLREQGPTVAEGPGSIGIFAIRVLNEGVRPFVLEWHSELGDYEDQERARQAKMKIHPGAMTFDDAAWPKYDAFYQALEEFQAQMRSYADVLAELAGLGE